MIFFDMLSAMGRLELMAFLWLAILLDIPRYLFSAVTLSMIPLNGTGIASRQRSVSCVIACRNEERVIRSCIEAVKANGISEIIVVNDYSTDGTYDVAVVTGVKVIDLPERIGKPLAINVGLPYCTGDAVLIIDADTVLAPGSVAIALSYLEGNVGGVCFNIGIRNESATLLTRLQTIEYLISFTVGKYVSDLFGILTNVSGAAGLFRREALVSVGGLDCEVAEDAALSMKLRVNGWELRYAPDAYAHTYVPETLDMLFVQRLRWDASIVTIWWRKFGFLLNPFSKRFNTRNLIASLDVLVFSMIMPLIFPVYLVWLIIHTGQDAFIILGSVLLVLLVVDTIVVLLVALPFRLLPYLPFYVFMQITALRPLRVFALVAELIFRISHYVDYIPKSQRHLLT